MIRANRVVVQLTCALATLFCAQAAQAQSTQQQSAAAQPAVEVTPFVGLGSSGSARVGGAIAFELTPKVRLETEVGYASRGLLSSSVNVVYSLPHLGVVEPYVTGGIGLCQIESALQVPSGLVAGAAGPTFQIQRSVALAINAGAGFNVPVREGVGYRFDARWSNPLGIAPETWRIYHGATFGVGK